MPARILNNIRQIFGGQDVVALVAFDAGAAAHIASWFKSSPPELRIYAEGPAKDIFAKAFAQPIEASLAIAIHHSTFVVTGTGWSSDLEHHARLFAHKQGINCAAVLDHWCNYRERFQWYGKEYLPDQLWVADVDAASLAEEVFPNIPILRFPNQWLDDLRIEVSAIRNNSSLEFPSNSIRPAKRLLYLLEPIRELWASNTHTTSAASPEAGEFQALHYFLNHLPHLIESGWVACYEDIEALMLRPHPSDASSKYNDFIANVGRFLPIRLSVNQSLADSLAWADAAFGCETQALVAAMNCGLPAFSTIPPWAPPCRLPQRSLHHLSRL